MVALHALRDGLLVSIALLAVEAAGAVLVRPSIYLKSSAAAFTQTISENNTVIGPNGLIYFLDVAKSYPQIFSSDHFDYSEYADEVVCRATGKTQKVAISRGKYEDGGEVLVSRDNTGKVIYIQILPTDSKPIYFLANATIDDPDQLLTFSSDDLDYQAMNQVFVYGNDVEPPKPVVTDESSNRKRQKPQSLQQRTLQNYIYARGDGTSTDCNFFKVISVAIQWDAEFCALFGSDKSAVEVAIQAIIATASVYFENDLCVKLALTGMLSDSCDSSSSTFRSFPKNLCSEDPGYLTEFSKYMSSNRDALGVDSSSLVHMFSGSDPPTPEPGSLVRGCAWQNGLCDLDFGYGVLYMSANHPDVVAQALLFAHELGHNLNAEHDPLTLKTSPDYIMEPVENDGSDGFSQTSIDAMVALIDQSSITCDSVEYPPTLAPQSTTAPVIIPTAKPTAKQTVKPTAEPTQSPTTKLTSLPSLAPSTSLTSQPVGTVAPTSTSPPSGILSSNPTLSPSCFPSDLPSAMPTTSNPSEPPGPTELPSERPSREPFTRASVSPSSTCSFSNFQVGGPPMCIFATDTSNAYSCHSKHSLLTYTFSRGCTGPVSVKFVKCTLKIEVGYQIRHRMLGQRHKRNKKGEGGKGDSATQSSKSTLTESNGKGGTSTSLGGKFPKPVKPTVDGNTTEVIASPESKKGAERSIIFTAPDCTSSCIDAGDLICFRASTPATGHKVLAVVYEVTDSSGISAVFETPVVSVVQASTSALCLEPLAQCTPETTLLGSVQAATRRRRVPS